MTVGPRGTLGGMLRAMECVAVNARNALPSSRMFGSRLDYKTYRTVFDKKNSLSVMSD